MDREGFRNRMKQYKLAREGNPGLKYWEWKAQPAEKVIPKYDEGVDNVKNNLTWWEKLRRDVSEYIMAAGQKYVNRGGNSISAFRPSQNVAQTSYLTDRKLQQKMFEQEGYTKVDSADYGLVKKAVGNRDIPVYQRTKDAKDRKDLNVIGNVDNAWLGAYNTSLEHAGSYPTALYVDKDGFVYQKAWDLNDYGKRTTGGKGTTYDDIDQALAEILDIIGSPTVVTTGFQPVYNFDHDFYGTRKVLNAFNIGKIKSEDSDELYDDADPYRLSILDEVFAKKGLHRIDLGDSYTYGLPEVEVKPKKYDEGGRVIPTQEEYITQQIDAKKAAALANFRNATEPVLPIINGEPNVNSCIYTALNMYGKKYATPGNWTFYDDPGKYGFKRKELTEAQPSDLIQVLDKNKPYHMMMLDGYDEKGLPLYNYSRGAKGDSSDIVKAKTNFPNTKKLAYEFVGTPADSTQWINDYKKLYGFAEGGEVTGPPTYEQWDAEMNQYNPTILDNASMYWSIEAAKKELHKQAMGLPGYAPMWHEYVRSLPKADPDINQFVDDLWLNENPNNVGYRNGKYYPHKSPEGGKMTIGPGFKLDSGSHGISTKTANRGMTKTRLDQEARKIGKQHLKAVDQFINYGQTTNPADTVSPQIKMGLMDLRHLVGPLNEWGNLRQAVLEGDLDRIRKESTVTWNDNGKIKVDKRRKKIRDEKYFYYE